MFKIRDAFKGYIIFIGFILLAGSANASFHKNLWPKWEANNPLSQKIIPHDDWQEF